MRVGSYRMKDSHYLATAKFGEPTGSLSLVEAESVDRLRDCHGKRLAVIVESKTGTEVFRGRASYRKFEFGNCLRVELVSDFSDRTSGFAFCICEKDWSGEIVADAEYGCDYQICLRL